MDRLGSLLPMWLVLALKTLIHRRRFIVRTLSMLLSILLGTVYAGGVAVLKEQSFHRDSSAIPVVYLRIIDSHGPYLRIVTSRGNVDIHRSKFADYIETPSSIPQSVQTEADANLLRTWLSSIEVFSARYSRSSVLLAPCEGTISAHLERFDSGEVRFEGTWVTPQELASMLERRKREAEALRSDEIEEVIRNEARKADGWVWKNGTLISPQEANKYQPTGRTKLSDTLWPLISRDLDGARKVLKKLSSLAATQNGTPKVRTQRLHNTIRNVFLAEFHLSRQIFSNATARSQAYAHDRRASEWMKPNAFGTLRKDEAQKSRAMAFKIRNDSAQKLKSRRAALLYQLHDAETVITDFHQLGELRVALALGEITRAIAKRNFPNGGFQSSLPDETFVTIRNTIYHRK